MKEFFFVVNPASANGTTRVVWDEIILFLDSKQLNYDYSLTSGPNEATTITRDAIKKGYKKIIAVGGDGTVNEVVNGFFDEQGKISIEDVALGVISRGTGCDLIKTLNIPKNYQGAVETLITGNTKAIDLLQVQFLNKEKQKEKRYCVNISDVGLGGYVAQRVNHTSKSGGGLWSYLRGTLLSILKYKNNSGIIEVDGKVVHQGEFSIVAAANGRFFGGGMELAPMAKIDDGYIEVITLVNMGKVELLYNLSKVYKGTHIGHPKVKHYRCKKLSVSSDEPLPLEIDGENPGFGGVSYGVVQKAIKVIC
ncbi:diacylglycerol kinase family lipid kinase [Alkalicella caledoniensis]|uniref:Diacylglycerol kinase family lipid kinase n=1 Tax=Alkalicella caledoniensis TaxID=2731377 RepID=A0A7G9W742_ALKCA|nr:diacylglycerol kinase family protein [Alkalicella caledoniensis]QNO14504.1 diacylglycerol kinase family lipid kinase [Alkalicella caledoniensis]